MRGHGLPRDISALNRELEHCQCQSSYKSMLMKHLHASLCHIGMDCVSWTAVELTLQKPSRVYLQRRRYPP
jgi:hypothetical protein